jgi:cytochrome P450
MTTSADEALDLADAVANFDAYDHEMAQNVFAITDYARSACPVAHSSAHGGYYLVTSYAEVRQALSDPMTFSSSKGVAFPHHQSIMMPPIDLDPPIQKDFRRLLNRYFSRAGITQHAEAIRALAIEQAEIFAATPDADVLTHFSAPYTANVLSEVILHLNDGDLLARARTVAGGIARNDPNAEGDRRAELAAIVEEILAARLASGERMTDTIDGLLYGEVEGRPVSHAEQVGSMMILIMGGLSTTSAAITNILRHTSQTPGLEAHLRDDEWTKHELDEFLRFEAPVSSLSRTVMKDTVLGDQPLKAGDVVVLHFGSANRDESVFPHADVLDLNRENNPHLSFGLGDHRCIGSNLARMQIEVGIHELLSRVENVHLVEGTVLQRETGSGSGWLSLPVTFDRR